MTVHDPELRPAGMPTAAADPTEAGGILTIDLGALAANWKTLASTTVPVECAAVVKGDGYGCGLEPVTRTLSRAGCSTFFVADVAEGRRVRAVASDAAIYVLNGLIPGSAQAFAADYLRPVINSATELAEWDAFVATRNWRGGAALHVDTGMNRLGITLEEAVAIAPRLQSENHGFTLVMSHLACAEIPDHPMNDRQIRLFREIRILYRGVASSLANSSGIFLGGGAYCDLVRPGVALYGVNPTPGRANPMRPVVELKGRVIQVRAVNKGESVGYGAAFTTTRPSRIAIVALGYADGYLRSASAAKGKPAGQVIIAGKRCPIAGRVSMDVLAADVTDLPDGTVRRGDFATLIGDGMSVDDVAAAMGTIGYEVLTHLGRRYHRVYKGA
ncbi:MAG TPA: alanine racemase [Xanthobacteraceae bacterium]|jgi:alanine racemase|nr:alanine racemase [Xanthobacteraceae bacterium]